MYTRQKRNQMAIGFNGGFGQIPTASATGLHPVNGSTINFSGPAPDVANASAVLNMCQAAVTAAKNSKHEEAAKLIDTAEKMLPALGTLKEQFAPLVIQSKNQVLLISPSTLIPLNLSTKSTKSNSGLLLMALGVAAVVGAVFFFKRK